VGAYGGQPGTDDPGVILSPPVPLYGDIDAAYLHAQARGCNRVTAIICRNGPAAGERRYEVTWEFGSSICARDGRSDLGRN
jgi:hypothetical protein